MHVRVKELLHVISSTLKEVTDIPQKEAMILLGEVLNKEMSWLVAHSDDTIEMDERLENYVKRRSLHEPLEYILQKATFYGRDFYVDNRVLIPRPETELLVEHVVELSKEFEHPSIVEIGCGSGIISIMLALMLPNARLIAVDISNDALAVSQHNAHLHGVSDRITFLQSSYLDAVDGSMDILVSNPPYIANNESLGQGLSFEPNLALFGGERGDEMLRHIIDLYCERNIGVLACEMGYDQRLPLMKYAQSKGLEVSFYKDLANLDRGFWIKEKR